jgi:hypothetical protein
MSSENGHKTVSSDAAPASAPGPRSNARVASTWGAARDAVAAVHNLDVLLRTSSVPWKTLRDLFSELRSSAGVLRQAFASSRGGEAAAAGVGVHGERRVDELEAILEASRGEPADRAQLAGRTGALADELEACVDLLTLLDLAGAPAVTEVTLGLVAREVGRVTGSSRGREVAVLFDEALPDGVVVTDPYVLGPLLSLVVACVHASGSERVALRARSSPQPQFVVEPAGEADPALPTLRMRVMPWIAPSEAAARRVAQQLGAVLTLETSRASIVLGPGQRD